MQYLNRTYHKTKTYPEKILQFGGGNFLRAFVDGFVQDLNEMSDFNAGVVLVKPTPRGNYNALKKQDGLYTLLLRGIKNGAASSEHRIIDCIQRIVDPYTDHAEYLRIAQNPDLRFVFSNTTEAGITYREQDRSSDTPQESFPGKLTALLYERFKHFKGHPEKGLILIPCELIEKNGTFLQNIMVTHARAWKLENEFIQWIEQHNVFCNTLVDRIVPGFPKDEYEHISAKFGYSDELMVVGEYFHAWVIEGPASVQKELPFDQFQINAIFTNNISPYRKRKVRILNGAHTVLVPIAYLCGLRTVRASVEDHIVGEFLKNVLYEEILPTLDFPENELVAFTDAVLDRFLNPFIEHQLISISLNSVSKYKTRVLPTLLDVVKTKEQLPKGLVFALAAMIVFYKGSIDGEHIALKDEEEVLIFFKTYWANDNIAKLVSDLLANTSFWEADLTKVNGLLELTTQYVLQIEEKGMKNTLISLTAELKNK